MQTTLTFEPDITIPHTDMALLKACNNARRGWVYKQLFYDLKNRILEKYATVSGYDVQTVRRECYTCRGTGWYEYNRACYNCIGSGVYSERQFFLQRYVLNGELFHRPVDLPVGQQVGAINGLVELANPK